MSLRPIDTIIARHEFFKEFRPEHLEILQACAQEARYNRDQYLTRQGQGAERFFLIRKGLVRVELLGDDGKPIPIQTVGPDEIVGWSWMVPPYRWNFDVRAQETTIAIVFDGSALRKNCEKDFELGFRILQRVNTALHQRLAAMRGQLLELHSKWEFGE